MAGPFEKCNTESKIKQEGYFFEDEKKTLCLLPFFSCSISKAFYFYLHTIRDRNTGMDRKNLITITTGFLL